MRGREGPAYPRFPRNLIFIITTALRPVHHQQGLMQLNL